MKCKFCGKEYEGGRYCPNCGSNNENYVEPEKPVFEETSNIAQEYEEEEPIFEGQVYQGQQYNAAPAYYVINNDSYEQYRATLPPKSKIAAGLLALLLGGIGIHEFYLGRIGLGIIFLLFSWTFIPAIVAFIQGIVILVEDSRSFEETYHVRDTDRK